LLDAQQNRCFFYDFTRNITMITLKALILASLPQVGMSPDPGVMNCQFPATEQTQYVELDVKMYASLLDPLDRTAMKFHINGFGPMPGQILAAPLAEDRNVLLRASVGPDFLFVAAINLDGSAMLMPYDLTAETFASPVSQPGRCERHENIVTHWSRWAEAEATLLTQ
jgi:hypothetical protein